MRKPVILITGANGEIGHGLVQFFAAGGQHRVVALDLNPCDPRIAEHCVTTIAGDILDDDLMQRLITEFEIHEIYHLAALLSTRSEYSPVQAHRVNVNGTLNLLQTACEQARWHGHTVKFLFPSSIAAYGLPDRATKDDVGAVKESEFNFPSTMYGCNKLYCEQLGRYYTLHLRQLAAEQTPSGVDFRSLRFPGLISALTVPSGGTSDYGPEMLHAAAQGLPYDCFVDAKATLPFMAMPDAIKALIQLAAAPTEALTQRVYNVTGFSLAAEQIRQYVLQAFPTAKINYRLDRNRARIVDSWPAVVDDSAARRDWSWQADYDAKRAFQEYLIPNVRGRYAK